MTLRPLDELDLVAGGERHDRLLPVGAPSLGATHTLQLSLERGRPDGRHLDVEHGLDRHADLDLVRVGPDRNATVFCSSFCRMLFSVMSGRIKISRAVRLIVAIPSRPAWTEDGLRQMRPGSVVAGSSRPP